MKKFNAFELFMFGKEVGEISRLKREDTKLGEINWALYQARESLAKQLLLDSILLPASKRAASELAEKIDDCSAAAKTNWRAIPADNDTSVAAHKIYYIKDAADKLEAVLSADMPGISSYVVAQKGIYKTEDLVGDAKKQLTANSLAVIPDQAKRDVDEAGRCLAFELSTASAFHMWQAVEEVMCVYFFELTGQTVEDAKIQRNWFSYIKSLNDANAESRITEFLDHIRKEYRNPIAHPEVNIEIDEALNLFSTGCSSINQMASEVSKTRSVHASSSLSGLAL